MEPDRPQGAHARPLRGQSRKDLPTTPLRLVTDPPGTATFGDLQDAAGTLGLDPHDMAPFSLGAFSTARARRFIGDYGKTAWAELRKRRGDDGEPLIRTAIVGGKHVHCVVSLWCFLLDSTRPDSRGGD